MPLDRPKSGGAWISRAPPLSFSIGAAWRLCLCDAVNQVTTPEHGPSETAVPLRKHGGTLMVPVTINNAIQLDFIIDSGSADVSIPKDVVWTLRRTGTISDT